MSSSRNSLKPIIPPLELIEDSPDSSDDEEAVKSPPEAEPDGPEAEKNGNENVNNRDISPESGIDLASRGVTEDESTIMSTERTVIPPNELFNFDLTDPDEVVKMLETVNLTDEDTEVLLQEAYNVNMKLKEILRRSEKEGGDLKPSDIATLKGSNVVVVPGGNKKTSTANSRNNSAKRSQFSKAQPLPPITHATGSSSNMRVPSAVYSAKLHRPVPPPSASHPSQKRNASSSTMDRKVGSRHPSAAMPKSQKSGKKRAPSEEGRPTWNDRFMYE